MTASQNASCTRMLIWHLATTLVLLLLMPWLLHDPLWGMSRAELLTVGLLLLGYSASGVVPVIACWRGRRLTTLQVLLESVALFGVAFLCLLLAQWPYPRILLATVFAAAVLVHPVINARPRSLLPILPLAALLLGAGLIGSRREAAAPFPFSAHRTTLVRTALYNLQVDFRSGVIPRSHVLGGGVARVGKDYLGMTGDGLLYLFGWRGDADSFFVRALPYNVPTNLTEFAAGIGLKWPLPPPEAPFWFRGALGLLTEAINDSLRVYASYIFWHGDRRCFAERVAMLEAPLAVFLKGEPVPAWRMVYETTPCLPLHGSPRPEEWVNDASWPVGGYGAGGRMTLAGRDSLLLTVGDFEYDGVTIPGPTVAQDSTGSYGKTILIHLDGRAAEIFSMGHRNPQGLFRDKDGTIWLTEHGPQAGDELNLIVRGANYGWPRVTYGTNYGSTQWPLNQQQGGHAGYEAPVYAWVPSIAVSDLIRIEGGLFPAWRGDFLVGTLGTLQIQRVRTRGRQVVYAEGFRVGKQVRALVEGEDGRIVFWTDDTVIGTIAPNRGASGEASFALRCGGCHAAGKEAEYKIGPNLAGVVGRPVASAPGFLYSAALRALGGKWTAERLDAFIAHPRGLAPSTTMAYPGLNDSAERAAIIEYLRIRR